MKVNNADLLPRLPPADDDENGLTHPHDGAESALTYFMFIELSATKSLR